MLSPQKASLDLHDIDESEPRVTLVMLWPTSAGVTTLLILRTTFVLFLQGLTVALVQLVVELCALGYPALDLSAACHLFLTLLYA